MSQPSDRVRTLLALEDLKASRQPKPSLSGRGSVEGFNSVSGRVQVRLANGAIADVQPALISDLGLGDIGHVQGETFV